MDQGDYLCKLDFKDGYFCVSLNNLPRKYVCFEWEGSVEEIFCLCFGLGPEPGLFKKLIKVPVSIFGKLYIRIVVYLDNFLILGKTLEETILSSNTVIYLLQNLGFFVNLKKSVLHPRHRIEILGMIINTVEMNVSLLQEKVATISKVSGYIINARGVNKRPRRP